MDETAPLNTQGKQSIMSAKPRQNPDNWDEKGQLNVEQAFSLALRLVYNCASKLNADGNLNKNNAHEFAQALSSCFSLKSGIVLESKSVASIATDSLARPISFPVLEEHQYTSFGAFVFANKTEHQIALYKELLPFINKMKKASEQFFRSSVFTLGIAKNISSQASLKEQEQKIFSALSNLFRKESGISTISICFPEDELFQNAKDNSEVILTSLMATSANHLVKEIRDAVQGLKPGGLTELGSRIDELTELHPYIIQPTASSEKKLYWEELKATAELQRAKEEFLHHLGHPPPS